MSADRREARQRLGADAVVSVSEAAAWLPRRDSEARAWLERRGLVRDHPALGEVVIWGEVLAAIRADTAGPSAPDQVAPELVPARRPDVAKMPRAGLPGRSR